MKKSIIGFAAAMLLACTVAFAGNENIAGEDCSKKCCDAKRTCACATTENCGNNNCTSCAPGAECSCTAAACAPDKECAEAACCSEMPECTCN